MLEMLDGKPANWGKECNRFLELSISMIVQSSPMMFRNFAIHCLFTTFHLNIIDIVKMKKLDKYNY